MPNIDLLPLWCDQWVCSKHHWASWTPPGPRPCQDGTWALTVWTPSLSPVCPGPGNIAEHSISFYVLWSQRTKLAFNCLWYLGHSQDFTQLCKLPVRQCVSLRVHVLSKVNLSLKSQLPLAILCLRPGVWARLHWDTESGLGDNALW